ncbi:MAG: cytochrome c [Elusimicrobia bacterium]|nr:cytochrome c [Elusimicrobiota bacterium]
MTKIQFFLLTLSFAALFSGCASQSESASSVSRGEGYFAGYGCATCHRIGNEGGRLGPDLTTIGFRKSKEWLDLWLKNPPEWKKNTLMPNFYLKDSIRKDMVDYLVSLKGDLYESKERPWNKSDLMADPRKRGETIFNSVGCVGCHGVTGKGGYPNNNVVGGAIPTLTRVADGFSKEELKDRIRKGSIPAPANPQSPSPMITMPAWGKILKEDELDALVEYLYSLRPPVSEEEAW